MTSDFGAARDDAIYEWPSADALAQYRTKYGLTGVHLFELEQEGNPGTVAVCRELSLEERALLYKLEALEREGKGGEPIRTAASLMLLWPASLDQYPMPALAAAEIYTHMAQRGHGRVGDEPQVGAGENIPQHLAKAVLSSREAMKMIFTDSAYTTFLRDVIISACMSRGTLDLQLLEFFVSMPMGRVRDTLARLEQVHRMLLEDTRPAVEKIKNPKEKAEAARRFASTFSNPFETFDSLMARGFARAQAPPETPAPLDQSTLRALALQAFG